MLKTRPLTESDIPAAWMLSTDAGWNQSLDDWRRLIKLWPDQCLAGELDGRVIATTTLASYPPALGGPLDSTGSSAPPPAPRPVAWVGMVLVHPAHRGQGHATTLLRAALTLAEQKGLSLVGLDATDLGRPVYLKHDFADHSPIARWTLRNPPIPSDSLTARPLRETDWPALLDLDREATLLDRSALLQSLATQQDVTVHLSGPLYPLEAFGFLRPGRDIWHIGPVIARTPTAAQSVLSSLHSLIGRWVPKIYDLPASSPLAAHFTAANLTPSRELIRMSRPATARPLLTGPMIYAAAGFELG